MTTNQTIDGELRDLLERVCTARNTSSGWIASADAIRELRALLDAPAKDPFTAALEHLERFKEVARSGDVSGIIEMGAELIGMAYFDNQEAGNNVESTDTALHGGDGLSNSDGDCVLEHSVAAQPQSEPVALPERKVIDENGNGYGWSMFDKGFNCCLDGIEALGPLYAEQPAPVAVVRYSDAPADIPATRIAHNVEFIRHTEPVAPEPHGDEKSGYVQSKPKHINRHGKVPPAGNDRITMRYVHLVGAGDSPVPITHTQNGVIVNLDGYTCYAPGAEPKVVLPERKPKGIHKTDEAMGYYFGWNAYDDEYKRLNGIKP